MNIDVEIYMSNIVKFFKTNPNDLLNLVPKDMEDEFYKKIREAAIENFDKGEDVTLTQKQMIGICLVLNNKSDNDEKVNINKITFDTKFGSIILN
jgi:hypothetical protein